MSDERRYEIEVPLEATPDQVWDAISTPEGMTAWFAPMDPAPDENGISADGVVTRWEPGHGYVVQAGSSSYEYLIEARDGGSAVLRFTQTGFQSDDWEAEYEATSRGWGLYFHTLAQYLSNFAGQPATYIVAEGPAWSNTQEAWQKLQRVVGTSIVRDKVQLEVYGLEPVVGLLDYFGPSHIGVRTDQALLRFHGRNLLGMSVALGHHYYGNQDAKRLEDAWQSWLTELYL
ncbi:SRPBCC domain-containing protein [Kribbella sp. VKM Ac-2568]|uniref:SRPBCC family protein n=1 Tax=Kribbella sp. VKM Ac-2568 TaxID=2512219 RepID=UPI00104B7AFB|nr:SRPBCC domain-containing protein [Kribbella sp. VKM Ac-2568]TCM38963.1 uncharacterized protein YndB with AHSA1/START domain [Kribbella sp. VKM Ac-2568]